MPIAEVKRLRRQVMVLDDHLQQQKALLKDQSRHLGQLAARRTVQALRSPWAVLGAFALGLVAARVGGGESRSHPKGRHPGPKELLNRAQALLPLAMEIWPTVQALLAQLAAAKSSRKAGP